MPLPEFCLGCADASQLVPGPAPTHSERGQVAETLSSSSSSRFPQALAAPLARGGPPLVPPDWASSSAAGTAPCCHAEGGGPMP